MQRPPFPDQIRRSPTRGQLEPHDSRTAKGWRYLQTTDIPNQLKVLLPPGIAYMYEQLLKLEDYELRKGASLSWERILEIRHLKDRMIRKCQRLAKGPGVAVGLSFQTIVAPSDFRLREMEKWFFDQHARTQKKLHEKGPSTPCKCSKCLECLANQEGSLRVNNSKSSKMANQTNPLPPHKVELDQRPRYPLQPNAIPSSTEKFAPLPYQNKPTTAATPPSPRRVTSPPPLPHLLRIRNLETGFDQSDDPQRIVSLTAKTIAKLESSDSEPEPLKPTESSSVSNHQRVSWADNLDDQVAGYASAFRFQEIRDTYMEQMLGLEALHQQVEESLERLRSESEQLQRADETIRCQREMLSATFKEFERKQLRFQAKGEWLLKKTT
ncbi:hypothetical protein C0992_001963 [Termitomyces sp. T32_za158]|nr:hypothetical protein C0992_001963 [Termitomyces sp. T32_za158]